MLHYFKSKITYLYDDILFMYPIKNSKLGVHSLIYNFSYISI